MESEFKGRRVNVKGLRRVYQGGHHDVWCDGQKHVRTEGGTCHPGLNGKLMRMSRQAEFSCDCGGYCEEGNSGK